MRISNIILTFILIIIIIYSLSYTDVKEGLQLNNKPPFPIDIVYTWAGEHNDTINARIANNNELKYSLRSVMRYAPWVNKIYILMNPPKTKPSWFNELYSEKIVLIDHTDTFKQPSHLPTTNSNSIETTVVNIPELSEHFIYLNDDFYLGNYVSYLDFFNQDGSKIVVDRDRINNCKSMHIENTKQKMNIDLPIYCGISHHLPFANKKSIIKEFQHKYSDYIEWVRNIKQRKGTGGAYCNEQNLHKWCQQQHGLIAKFAYDNGYVVTRMFSPTDIIYVDYQYDRDLQKLNYINRVNPKFYCINDININNTVERNKFYKRVNNFMEKYYDTPTFFEN
jgi:hypothetical protein